MMYIDLAKEIAQSPDHWWFDFPDPARLISRQSVYVPRKSDVGSYSSSNYIRVAAPGLSWNTAKTLKKLEWTEGNFHLVFPSCQFDNQQKKYLGWVIQDPETNKFIVINDSPAKTGRGYFRIVTTPIFPSTDRFSYQIPQDDRDLYLLQDVFYSVLLKALRARIKLAKKNNPDLFIGMKDSKASVVQLDVMTKFHRLDSKIELFKAKINSSPNSELYKQDLLDLLGDINVFSNGVKNPSELKHLKSRPKPKKKK